MPIKCAHECSRCAFTLIRLARALETPSKRQTLLRRFCAKRAKSLNKTAEGEKRPGANTAVNRAENAIVISRRRFELGAPRDKL